MNQIARIILLAVICIPAQAQQLVFMDEEEQVGIPYLTVIVSEQARTLHLFTDAQGRLNLPALNYPVRLQTSHINYPALSDTLRSATNKTYGLKAKTNALNDVIVTGQFAPQSMRNSVFRVATITREEIENRGAITLEQALQNRLNMRISQDLAIGNATVSLQGISAQNVKILIDGVPLVNRNGNGNAADLSQINLQQIERLEIVEGPMAINYGANALAGVVNLITKKDFERSTEVSAFVQSETAGNEAGPRNGKHVQSLQVNKKLSKKWSLLSHIQHNDFQGFTGSAPLRTHEWNPKNQLLGSLLVKFETPKKSIYYRGEALNELIEDFGRPQNNFQPNGQNQPFAIDETYTSQRHTHQLQAEGRSDVFKQYNLFLSFSDFQRQKSRFSKNLINGEERLTTGEGDQDLSTYRVWESGGSTQLSVGSKTDIQLGYQLSLEKVGGGRIAKGHQGIAEYSVYSSAEWMMHPKLVLRPGVRFTHNSSFGQQLIPALQVKYELSSLNQLRLSYGRGFRAPSVRELYFEFVDSNHRIFGNPNLKPETSHHVGLNLVAHYSLGKQAVQTDINLFYNQIEDQIGIGQLPNDITSATYININQFKTLGINIQKQATWRELGVALGAAYVGRSNRLQNLSPSLEQYLYSPELNAHISYYFKAWGSRLNLYYKYTGKLQSYFVGSENNTIQLGGIEDYHWLEATINQHISKRWQMLLGARNLFNIRQLSNSGAGGGAHSGGSSVALSYGRSYFIKISYNLQFK